MSDDINVEALLDKCESKYYSQPLKRPEKTILDIHRESDRDTTITLDIGTFTVHGIDPGGGVEVSSTDDRFIDYYNATKFWPYGENIMEGEIERARFKNNKIIASDAIDHWLAVSDTVKVDA